MDFPKNIFKAYDVRGLYPEELNEEIAYKIARAYGQMRQKELGRNDLTIATGRDMRLSSPLLHEAIKRGLTEQGIQAVGLGLCSTPTFYYAVAHYGYNGGLLISASHNPKEYNGVKIVRER
ncbi:MAG: phosphomannomutase, partial [Patescibacteria group bacterium]